MLPRIERNQDVVEYLKRHPITPAFKRALADPLAKIEPLGRFTPAGEFPYWAVRVTSRFKRVWLVRLVIDTERNTYGVHCDVDGRPTA